jgi:iron complex outermembrane receptor protein
MFGAILALALQEPPLQEPDKQDLTDLSIEDLLQVEITSVSKKTQKLIEAPSAVFVLRGDDIRRAGATSVPEALRMVPGVQVARIDSSKWAISARGFNDRFANKLLVLIDGRSVYTPLFSGVFWDVQDTLLDDIDRIEVIRGPGATTWGANAVNGVINIITKSAKDTHGGFTIAKSGSEELGTVAARSGGSLGDAFHYRAFAKGGTVDAGYEGEDDWWTARGGFRGDWTPSEADSFTFSGDYYEGVRRGEITIPDLLSPTLSTTYEDPSYVTGADVLGRWHRSLGERASLEVQAYWDYTRRDSDYYGEARHTGDLAFQIRFPFAIHDIVAGAGYRISRDSIDGGPTATMDHEGATTHLINVFLQDEMTLVPDRLRLILGSKLEYNSESQLEYMPGARMLWTPHEKHAVWASASRSVRTPSRAEADIQLDLRADPGVPPVLTQLFGNDDLVSEKLLAFELGYRAEPVSAFSADVALFFNIYDDLRTTELGTPGFVALPVPHIAVPLTFDNRMSARSYGAEVALRAQPLDGLRLLGTYSFLHLNLDPDSDTTAREPEVDERKSPRHQAFLGASADLPADVTFDLGIRYVSALRDVHAYIEIDARIAWKPLSNLEIAIVGQNLARPHHREFAVDDLGGELSDVERGAYLSVTWKW